MGLLSDPEYGSMRFIKVLKRIHSPLCFLFYIGAIVWFFLLGHREFNNDTYFSENALLPGLVTNEFNGEQAAKQFHNELLQELEDKYEDTDEMPVPWLVAKMSQIHLEVYTHNFTLNYPLGQGQVFKGTNVYGILRAPRTSSLEALVLTVPYRPLSSHQKGTTAGIALMLAFAQFARPKKYWAKDIIFLVTEHEQLGMQAWLEAYHGLQSDSGTFYTNLGSFWKSKKKGWEWTDHSRCLDPGTLKGRSGSIQAAINLEFHTPKIKYIEVKVEGLNGQLPNLDLVNLVHKLCVKSGIHHSYKNSYAWVRNRNSMDGWVDGVWTMLGMMSAQIAGVPNGNHGLFHRFGIEAVTLEGRDADDPAGAPPRVHQLTATNFYRLGTALESIFRSLNNLLERFHQSYFFYLLAATDRFISIGQYMPSLCLLCGAMLIRALSLWVTIQKEEDKKEEKKDNDGVEEEKVNEESEVIENREGLRKRVKGDLKDKKRVKEDGDMKETESISVVSIGANYFLAHLIGSGVMNSPFVFSHIGAKYLDRPSEVSVYYGLFCVSALIVVITPFLLKLFRQRPANREELTIINILLLIEMSTLGLCVGMHNISLGLCVCALYTPLALLVGVREKRSLSVYLKQGICLLLHPLVILTVCMMVYSRILFPEESLPSALGRGRDAAMQAIMFSIVDSLIYGNWLFNVATTVLLPVWIISWQLLCVTVA
ncbi:glycosylphosphatidylinositol anchor attachment 1 protein [Pieris brassicae]|uniref:glycosylphosphatidylinositol anchor attachment 1 protein n=1 Tax=Pieris brassicae TaxID=7116 RepID=UPI001E65F504|nr:glycosylphosphatidylinositol anchor attachment 1 protein [Pieris brassicae]